MTNETCYSSKGMFKSQQAEIRERQFLQTNIRQRLSVIGIATMSDEKIHLSALGARSGLPASPNDAILECVPNPHQETDYFVRFTCPEFTALCPVTGQPDFAHIVIDYVPDEAIVESKSLKLFLASFRNHGAFHEDCTIMIGKRILEAAEPKWLRIGGYWYPRGGIPIDVFWQTGKLPENIWAPEQNVPSYRGRG